VKWRQEELAANLSLEAFLDRAHSVKFPHLEPGDDFDPGAYMAEVAEAVFAEGRVGSDPRRYCSGILLIRKIPDVSRPQSRGLAREWEAHRITDDPIAARGRIFRSAIRSFQMMRRSIL